MRLYLTPVFHLSRWILHIGGAEIVEKISLSRRALYKCNKLLQPANMPDAPAAFHLDISAAPMGSR